MFQSAREKIISNHCGGSFRRAGNCPARFRQSRYGLSCAVFFILFLSIPSVIMAVPGHDKGRSVYREALSLTEHGQNAKALFLLNQLSDSLSMLHSGVSEQKLLMDVKGLKAKNYMALGDMDKALRLYRDAMKKAKSLSDERSLALFCNEVFGIYYSARQYSNAKDLLLRALEININLKDSSNIRNNYITWGSYLITRKNIMRPSIIWMKPCDIRRKATDSDGRWFIPTVPRCSVGWVIMPVLMSSCRRLRIFRRV